MDKKAMKAAAARVYMGLRRSEWDAPKVRAALTAAEKTEVEKLWGGVWSKPNYRWHEHYKALNGEFDPRYLPTDVLYLDMMPQLSDRALAAAWADKAYYCERFPEARFPGLLLACIGGKLVDGELRPVSWEDAFGVVRGFSAVFVKPSLDSSQGRGAFKLDVADVHNAVELEAALRRTGRDFVVQELIEQHEVMSSFNPSSVNIIRMNTARLDGEPWLANATVRFCVEGQVTDVCYINGVEITRVAGVGADGRLRGFYCDQDGKRFGLEELGIGGQAAVPGYDKAVELCLNMHRRMHHFGLVAFDVAIDKDGEPLIIEFNLNAPGAVLYQYANGPFFGERTEEVIAWCAAQKRDPAVKVVLV